MTTEDTKFVEVEYNKNVFFILVRPVYLGNIGAFARLAKNFGFQNLRFVDAPKNYKDAEARKMAVGAFDLLKNSETFATLKDAVHDIGVVIGTTAGQQRTQALTDLGEVVSKLALKAQNNKIAVVFGDERNGLSNEELAYCHVLTRIETNKNFPSLNVAQAACIVAYELSKQFRSGETSLSTADKKILLPTGRDDEELFQQMERLLELIDFSRKFNKDVVTKELRRFYYKAGPSKRESDLLRGILHKLNQALASNDPPTNVDEE